eukprot:6299605-Prymnesium_polylepis.1
MPSVLARHAGSACIYFKAPQRKHPRPRQVSEWRNAEEATLLNARPFNARTPNPYQCCSRPSRLAARLTHLSRAARSSDRRRARARARAARARGTCD